MDGIKINWPDGTETIYYTLEEFRAAIGTIASVTITISYPYGTIKAEMAIAYPPAPIDDSLVDDIYEPVIDDLEVKF